MHLNQLKYAQAVAATGSFTEAASLCCVTQPTLSNSISQLEEELGEALFVRTTRKVTVTTFGEQLLPYIADLLSAQDILLKQAQAFRFPEKQLLRIGTSPLINADLIGAILDPFKANHPNIDLILREMNMGDLKRMLQDGLLDFVLGVASMTEPTWESTNLYSEPLIYIPAGKDTQYDDRTGQVSFNSIANETFVMVPDACGLARTTRALFRQHRKKLNEYKGEALSYQVLTQWAELGIGAAILPKSKLPQNKKTALMIKDKSNQIVDIQYQASWLPSNITAPPLVEFAKHLTTIAPAIVSGLHL